MAKRKSPKKQARLDEQGSDPRQVGPDSAGQSGDAQGLRKSRKRRKRAFGELAETDQAFEADIVEGVEEAGDHPEEPARTHEDKRRS